MPYERKIPILKFLQSFFVERNVKDLLNFLSVAQIVGANGGQDLPSGVGGFSDPAHQVA